MSKKYKRQRDMHGDHFPRSGEWRGTTAKFALCAAVAAGLGAAGMYGVLRRGGAPEQPRAPVLVQQSNPIENMIMHFASFDLIRQREIVDRVFTRVDRESGMGAVYDYIISTVSVPRKTLAELSADSDDAFRRMAIRCPTDSVIGYNALIPGIIETSPSPQTELVIMMQRLLTRKGMEATMRIHHIQSKSSPDQSTMNYVERYLTTRDGRFDDARLSEKHVRAIARDILKDSTASTASVRSYLLQVFQRQPECRALFTMGAAGLSPKLAAEEGGGRYKVPLEVISHGNPSVNLMSAPIAAAAYGHEVSRGKQIPDVEANMFIADHIGYVGSPVRNVQDALRKLPRGPQYYQEQGDTFLRARARSLESAIGRVVAEEIRNQ